MPNHRTPAPSPTWSAGQLAELVGCSVRTLQYYDRIGLLTAPRTPAGRRCYGPPELSRLQRILLLTGAGVSLAEVAVLLDEASSPLQTYRAQIERLELVELRSRCQRSVLMALTEVLQTHPQAEVPAAVVAAVLSADDTLFRYPVSSPAAAADIDEPGVEAVLEVYFTWKAAAVRAVTLAHNDIAPDSPSGLSLGRVWGAAVAAPGQTVADVLVEGEQQHHAWPAGDRELHRASKEFLDQCLHHARVAGGDR